MHSLTPSIVLLLAVSIMNGFGQVLMRWSGRGSTATAAKRTPLDWLWHSRGWFTGLLICWLCGLGWALVLSRVELAFALPIFVGLGFLTSAVGGGLLLAERLTPAQWLGSALILAGIILIAAKMGR